MLIFDPRLGGLFASRNILFMMAAGFIGWVVFLPTSPAQAGLAGFLAGAALWLWYTSRRQLEAVRILRTHRPRVFEGDYVDVTLRIGRGEGWPIQLLELEDRFHASLEIRQAHLIPSLSEGWEVLVHFQQQADRHRGVYFLGPVVLRASDGLGVFVQRREAGEITRLTVYPRAEPLDDYNIPVSDSPAGSSMDDVPRLGQGEEILGVREYIKGDPRSRIHWRTSMRRGQWHVLQLNRFVQAELAVMMDMSRRARFGLGAETSTEMAICAATSLLTRGYETRHRLSLSYAQQSTVRIPTGTGLDHLHMLLDRLAVLMPGGETDFWEECSPLALQLPRGSRVVFISASANTPLEQAEALVKRLRESRISVDVVLIDQRDFIKIYQDQESFESMDAARFDQIAAALHGAGARVIPVSRAEPQLSARLPHVTAGRGQRAQGPLEE